MSTPTFYYFKISAEDIEIAEQNLANKKQLGEFLVALIDYYRTGEMPTIKTKPVKNFLKSYEKVAKFILKQRIKRCEVLDLESEENQGLQPKSPISYPTSSPTSNPEAAPSPKVKDKLNISKEYIDFDIFLDWFNKTTNRNFKKLPEKTKAAYNARLNNYTKMDIMNAIVNCSKDPFHVANPKFLTPEFMSREDKIEKYLNVAKPPQVTLPTNWFHDPLTPEQWAILTPEQTRDKKNNDTRKSFGI